MPSEEEIAARRQEYIRMAKEMNPYAIKKIDAFVELITNEGDIFIWLYKDLYPCRIKRNQDGIWCGYVGVPHGHPCYAWKPSDDKFDINVHGGLTFAEQVHDWAKDNFWFLGFDTGHAFDVSIMSIGWAARFGDMTYKDKGYVIAETNKLARQLEEIEKH